MNNPIIKLNNVSVQYGHLTVLENITIEIFKGEIIAIVGPNGSGKSTLVKTILGLKEPSDGTVTVFEQPAHDITGSGRIGYLPQAGNYNSLFPISAWDVVAMARQARKGFFERLTKDDREKIHDALEVVNMADFMNHHFGSLSGGQKQRILIARALVLDPELLVLDEPSTGLDAVSQDSFYHLLRDLRDQRNISILFVSHDIGTVSNIVDRLACVKKHLHFHGKPEDCQDDESLARVFGSNIYVLRHDEECETCRREHD